MVLVSEIGLEIDMDTCLIRAPGGPGAYLSGRKVGTGGPVEVTRFVHVDRYNRSVLDEEEYKGKWDVIDDVIRQSEDVEITWMK